MGNTEMVGYVYKTKFYEDFKTLEGNRDADHINSIKKSISDNGLLFNPILVNENMEIIDGQNRFFAAKELGLPIFYIIHHGYGIEESRVINQNKKNWCYLDIINSYAREGRHEYIYLKRLTDRFPELPAVMIACMAKEGLPGNWKDFGSNCSIGKRAAKIGNMVMAYKGLDDNINPIFKRPSFISAIIKLSRCEDFDNDEVIRKIRMYPREFKPCVKSDDYIRMIEDIVNYRRRQPVRFKV